MSIRRGLLYSWLVLSVSAAACDSSGNGVATLQKITGTVDQHVAPRTVWQSAVVGTSYRIGDSIRTGRAALAQLKMTRGGKVHVHENSLIRFARSVRDYPVRIDVESGEAIVDAEADGALAIDTSIGVAQLSGGGRVRLVRTDKGAKLEVLVGTAQLLDDKGNVEVLQQNESIEIEVGDAIELPLGDSSESPPDRDAGNPAPDSNGHSRAPEPTPDSEVPVVATVSGRGGEIRASDSTEWRPLPVGELQPEAGSSVRLPKKVTMQLRRGEQAATAIGAAEFQIGASGEALIEASRGVVRLESSSATAVLKVPGGVIVARVTPGGSRGQVEVGRKGTAEVTVERGELEVRGRGGDERLVVGERASLDRNGETAVAGRAPGHTDFTIPAGESATIHDPVGKTALRIDFAKACPGRGRLEMARKKSRLNRPGFLSEGQGSARAWVSRGTVHYQVRCIDDAGEIATAVAARGTIRLRKHAATKTLPQKAPRNDVEADGLTYKLVYQNHLPRITFRWREAPSGPLSLVVEARRGRKTTVNDIHGKQYTLESGKLAEGTYKWWFESKAGKRSRTTNLKIEFDSTASTAHLTRPEASAWSGASVPIAGATLPGWDIEIGGVPVTTDSQNRFQVEAKVPEEENAIAVRMAHERHGIHYYLRRRPP